MDYPFVGNDVYDFGTTGSLQLDIALVRESIDNVGHKNYDDRDAIKELLLILVKLEGRNTGFNAVLMKGEFCRHQGRASTPLSVGSNAIMEYVSLFN